jgi:hypothetical protein
MNEYGMSPFQVLQMVGPMMFLVPMLLWVALIGPLVIYPIARWKLHREQGADNQLGLKVALHYFRMAAFQLVLLGAVVLVYAVIGKGSDKGDIYRAAFGFLVPAGIVLGVHSMLVIRTNDAQYPAVHRLFMGYNLLVVGLIGFTALVAGSQVLFAKSSGGGDQGRLLFAAVLVYCGAWAACGIQFGRGVLGGPGAGTGSFDHVVTPPVAAPPPPAGPSLPPLSAGSFPPIEPKG